MIKEQIKLSVKNWLLEINQTEDIPTDIIAISFNLYQPYGIELIGSKRFDKEDADWACEEDYIPNQRNCPDFNISNKVKWGEVLKIITEILKELALELSDTQIFKTKHIATGFVDGDLVLIK